MVTRYFQHNSGEEDQPAEAAGKEDKLGENFWNVGNLYLIIGTVFTLTSFGYLYYCIGTIL